MSAALCPLRSCRTLLLIEVVPGGAVVTRCPGCERRRAGICKDCPRRVYGTIGKALRCWECARRVRRESERKHRANPEVKRRIRERDRRRRREDPEYRERRRRDHVAWRALNPDKVRRQKRKHLLRDGAVREKYLATQRRHNRNPERAAKKRAAALAKYYELHPVRPDPKCTGCSVALPWNGTGRPRSTCDRCCTPAELVRRQRGYNTKAYRARRGVAA